MKVYTIYLDDIRGWTDNEIEGFYHDYETVIECADFVGRVLPKEEFNKEIEDLNIGETFLLRIERAKLEIKCEEMEEAKFNNLPEFSAW